MGTCWTWPVWSPGLTGPHPTSCLGGSWSPLFLTRGSLFGAAGPNNLSSALQGCRGTALQPMIYKQSNHLETIQHALLRWCDSDVELLQRGQSSAGSALFISTLCDSIPQSIETAGFSNSSEDICLLCFLEAILVYVIRYHFDN